MICKSMVNLRSLYLVTFITGTQYSLGAVPAAPASVLENRVFCRQEGHVRSVECSPDGRFIATISENKVCVWDVKTEQLLYTLTCHAPWFTLAKFSHNGGFFVTVDFHGLFSLWDVNGRRLVLKLKDVVSAQFSNNDRFIVIVSDGKAYILDTKNWALVYVLTHADLRICSATFSFNGRYIATVLGNDTVGIWDTNVGSLVYEFMLFTKYIKSINFSPDDRYIAIVGREHKVWFWDMHNWILTRELNVRLGAVITANFSSDGSYMVAVPAADGLRVWDTQSWTLLHSSTCPAGGVTSAQFSHDGKSIVTGSRDGQVRIWRDTRAEKNKASIRTFLMGVCARLGKDSPVNLIDDPYILQNIASFVTEKPFAPIEPQ